MIIRKIAVNPPSQVIVGTSIIFLFTLTEELYKSRLTYGKAAAPRAGIMKPILMVTKLNFRIATCGNNLATENSTLRRTCDAKGHQERRITLRFLFGLF